jgi:hypothetical protein
MNGALNSLETADGDLGPHAACRCFGCLGLDHENLFGEMSTACDFVDLVQNGFCTHPVVPLQGLDWAPFCNFDHRVSASYPLAKQVLKTINNLSCKV